MRREDVGHTRAPAVGMLSSMERRRSRLASDALLVRAHRAKALELVRQAESAANTPRADAFRAIAAELEIRALALDAELAELAAAG